MCLFDQVWPSVTSWHNRKNWSFQTDVRSLYMHNIWSFCRANIWWNICSMSAITAYLLVLNLINNSIKLLRRSGPFSNFAWIIGDCQCMVWYIIGDVRGLGSSVIFQFCWMVFLNVLMVSLYFSTNSWSLLNLFSKPRKPDIAVKWLFGRIILSSF